MYGLVVVIKSFIGKDFWEFFINVIIKFVFLLFGWFEKKDVFYINSGKNMVFKEINLF